jgi:hypothetical protein
MERSLRQVLTRRPNPFTFSPETAGPATQRRPSFAPNYLLEVRMSRRSMYLALAPLFVIPIASAMPQAPVTRADKIANAAAAAPAAIVEKATIMDWPAKEGAKMETLRAGSNGWTCLPDMPMTKGNDPMCVDDQWMMWMEALVSKTPPHHKHAGIGYMLAPGGAWGSNTDPYAEKETSTNEWGYDPPHVMLLVTDVKELQGLPTKRQVGAPWVMWSGTPYAHVMVPVVSEKK